MNRFLLMGLIVLASTACDETGQPSVDNGQTVQTSQPADQPLAVDAILDGMETAGRKHGRIAADLRYEVDQPMTGDHELRTGRTRYQRQTDDNPPRFYVGFDTLKLGEGAVLKDKVEYAFDGRWLTVAKHRIKQMTRYEIAEEGQTVDAFRLGKGPFPVPFGQEAAAMTEYFEITTRPLGPADPEGTHYLRLIPKPERAEELSFVALELWVDSKSFLPTRLVSRDVSKNVTTVTFTDVQTDVTFKEADFHLPRPIGWEYSEERK